MEGKAVGAGGRVGPLEQPTSKATAKPVSRRTTDNNEDGWLFTCTSDADRLAGGASKHAVARGQWTFRPAPACTAKGPDLRIASEGGTVRQPAQPQVQRNIHDPPFWFRKALFSGSLGLPALASCNTSCRTCTFCQARRVHRPSHGQSDIVFFRSWFTGESRCSPARPSADLHGSPPLFRHPVRGHPKSFR